MKVVELKVRKIISNFDVMWECLLEYVDQRKSLSSLDAGRIINTFAPFGIHDVGLIMWAQKRFGIKNTYALAQTFRDLALGYSWEDIEKARKDKKKTE